MFQCNYLDSEMNPSTSAAGTEHVERKKGKTESQEEKMTVAQT